MDDPAIGWTILNIGAAFLAYSAYWLISEAMRHLQLPPKWFNKPALQRLKTISRLFPLGCLLVIGAAILQLALQLELMLGQFTDKLALIWLLLPLLVCALLALAGEQVVRRELMRRMLSIDSTDKQHTAHIKTSYESKALSTSSGMVDFGEKTAREVMTPRLDMICLEWNESFQQHIETSIAHMRTRYPVVHEDKDDIVGFIHIKDLLAIYDDPAARERWHKWIRPIITVPESIEISQLLSMMQKKKTQIALLIDEYGGTSGMVTMEDIIEEIIGDIQDEFDEEEHTIVQLQPDEYRLSAMLLIEEVNSYFNINLEVDEMDSIGGYMYANIQFPPHIGQSVVYEHEHYRYVFTIAEMEQLRLTSLTVKRYAKEMRMQGR